MSQNRRGFLKLLGKSSLIPLASGGNVFAPLDVNSKIASLETRFKRFNMSGYAAPAIPTVRIGFIGVGNRGSSAVQRIVNIQGVDVKAICDIRTEVAERSKKVATDRGFKPTVYSGKEEAWKELCDRSDIDLVYICTPWHQHAPQAVYAMNAGKHVCVEVPACTTLEECWQLVETSEKTKKHCMMLENCCYDFFEMLTLNMARQGFFGEIVHGEGAYIHDLLHMNFDKKAYYDFWRLRENANRDGNLYPTHGLGPICQIMDINRGDKMDLLVSMSSNDFMMKHVQKEMVAKDADYKQFEGTKWRGNMNTSIIKTNKGRTIMLQHDVTSPRPYSRLHIVSGTKAYAQKYPEPAKISMGHDFVSDAEFKKMEAQYEPPLTKKIGELAKQVGGHGGMDFLMDWRTIDCLRNGLPLDQDVYDAALWSGIAPLTEISVKNNSLPVTVPDFTGGNWKTNAPVDISLSKGGNTGVKLKK